MIIEHIPITDLKDHPLNYQDHPDEQLEHLADSLTENDFYRNVVIAKDGTILAGHGVVQAAQRVGKTEVPAHRLDIEPDSPRALKILVGDNESRNLAIKHEIKLAELLTSINSTDAGLKGTGYDEAALHALIDSAAAGIVKTDKDSPEPPPAAQIKVSPELHERQDYLVIAFDNEFDWKVACDRLGVCQVLNTQIGHTTFKHKGTGRVIPASRLLEALGVP